MIDSRVYCSFCSRVFHSLQIVSSLTRVSPAVSVLMDILIVAAWQSVPLSVPLKRILSGGESHRWPRLAAPQERQSDGRQDLPHSFVRETIERFAN